jgi:hypothetical protein
MTYRVGCKTRPGAAWTYNAVRFATRGEAETYGADLYARWLALEAYEVHESDEPATYTMSDDGLKRIAVVPVTWPKPMWPTEEEL